VLAGPDPDSIQDDPEGVAVFKELCQAYRGLAPELQQDVALIVLPMESRKRNALIVNAMQRCSSIVVQNSLQEGFGLTVTEAMWKGRAVMGTHACGIRQQIRDGVDGRLTADPEDPDEIARNLFELLTDPAWRYQLGRTARRRVHDSFLVFEQLSRLLQVIAQVTDGATAAGTKPAVLT
jgi:trehalose synthase